MADDIMTLFPEEEPKPAKTQSWYWGYTATNLSNNYYVSFKTNNPKTWAWKDVKWT